MFLLLYLPESVMLYLPVLFTLLVCVLSMRDQSYAVKGRLICGTKPAANVRIKLWEEDSGPDPDDLLDSGYTDSNGEFRLSGGTAELTPIDPIFKVYHDCDDGIKPGKRKVKFLLPKSYITDGKVAKKEFDIGILNLETVFMKEERELIVTRKRRHRKEMDEYESSPLERLFRHRRGGVNQDYLDDTQLDDRIIPRQEERSGRNPC